MCVRPSVRPVFVRACLNACDCFRVLSESQGKPMSSGHFILTQCCNCRALISTRRRPGTAADSTTLRGSTETQCRCNFFFFLPNQTLALCNAPWHKLFFFNLHQLPHNSTLLMSYTPRNTCLLTRSHRHTCIVRALHCHWHIHATLSSKWPHPYYAKERVSSGRLF